MAFDPDFETVAGTRLYVAAGRPADDTATAFAALTWTEVGILSTVGDVTGVTSNMSTLANISGSINLQKKASSTRPATPFECAFVEDDPGQELVRTFASPRNYSTNSYKMVKQSGAIRYFTAQAMSPTETGTGIDDTVKFGFSLLRQSDTIRVGGGAPPAQGIVQFNPQRVGANAVFA